MPRLSSATSAWMISEIKETLAAYGWRVASEYCYDGGLRFACQIVSNRTGVGVTGVGTSRFAALQNAYEHAGLLVYK